MRAIDADAISYESIDSSDTGRHEHYYGTGIIAVRKEDIDAMPTIQPEPHWIPVTERLPYDKDYDETFIVTIQCEHVDGWDDYVTGYADWTPHGWDIQSYYMRQIKVTAWMPLPEPYKGVTE